MTDPKIQRVAEALRACLPLMSSRADGFYAISETDCEAMARSAVAALPPSDDLAERFVEFVRKTLTEEHDRPTACAAWISRELGRLDAARGRKL